MITEEAKEALIAWYRHHGRDLPWRRTRDPYRILVSEIMLQQTQVERVIPKYEGFLNRFPSVEALAEAPTSTVIQEWAGLGYNRRALNLQRACQEVIANHDGEIPSDVEELVKLPGIGPYTAGAIACFAFEQDVGFVDTNIRRVLHRVQVGPETDETALSSREVMQIATGNVPAGRGYEWNQALIELGALICKARVAHCSECPLASWCAARPVISEALVARSSRPRSREPKFETTNRYLRGRIVDLLRRSPEGLSETDLRDRIDASPSAERLSTQLKALVSEGLIAERRSVAEISPAYDSDGNSNSSRIYRLPD